MENMETFDETVERFVNALFKCAEKQKAKKPVTDDYDVCYLCPICNTPLYLEQKYCDRCGQRIKWDD